MGYGNYRSYNRRRGYNYGYKKNYRISRPMTNYKPLFTQYKRTPTKKSGTTAQGSALVKRPIFGTTKLVKEQLYYDPAITLTGGIGSVPSRYYSANGLWDPYIPAGGHQPIAFDQMMLLYEHYTCIRSKATVTFHNAAASPMRVGIYLAPDTTPPGSLQELIENGLVKTMVLDTATNKSTGTLSIDCDVKNYFGRNTYADLLDDAQLKGDIISNPPEQVYYVVFAYDPYGTATDPAVAFDIMISYDSIYSEPRMLDPS